MWVYIGALGKLKHLVEDPPPQESKSFDKWQQDDFTMITWLWNSMEPYVSDNFMFLETAKQIWKAVKKAYSHEGKKNSRIYQLYEDILGAKQNGKPLSEHNAFLKEM